MYVRHTHRQTYTQMVLCVVHTYSGFRWRSLDVCSFCVHGDTMASVGLMKYCLR